MSLPTISGIGFLIADYELKFSQNGNAYARMPLVFKNRRKDANGNWSHDKEILIEATVFGKLAESLAEVVTGKTDLRVTGDLYSEEYEGKVRTKLNVHSVWPVKEDQSALATASPRSRDEGNFPF